MPNKIRVRKKDQFRSLATEVLPGETTIIFSNDGLYLRAIKNETASPSPAEQIFEKLVKQSASVWKKSWFVPYPYKIRKNESAFRTLSLLHPAAQWQIRQFYEHAAPLILHYTSGAHFSIRFPANVSKTYFIRSHISDLARFKRGAVSSSEVDVYLRHSPSYFSYSGYNRLYKFFDSIELLELEARFSRMWTLDVSKCFDSIYTHSISWAVKSKLFTKKHLKQRSFAQLFDAVMQSANQGETNGIVIGPEVSRIFAEIILQEVDRRVETGLRTKDKLELGVHYHVRRYVDDYFVFANTDAIASTVYEALVGELWHFKLSINEAKVHKLSRPFLTPKSKTIVALSKLINSFTRKFASAPKADESNRLEPKEVYRPERLALSFCNDVKLCCTENGCGYGEVSGYLISALKNRAALLMANDAGQIERIGADKFFNALCLLVRVVFFFYTVAPSVTASYRLSTVLLMIVNFADKNLAGYAPSVKQLVYSLALDVLGSSSREPAVDEFVDLETQNLLLVLSELGEDYRVPSEVLAAMFCSSRHGDSYFSLTTLMFYMKRDPRYAAERAWAESRIGARLADLNEIELNAEKVLLALDFIGCPYIDRPVREGWAADLCKRLAVPLNSPAELADLMADFEALPWFIRWDEVDLLNLLERKELHSVY